MNIQTVPIGPYPLYADYDSPTGIKILQNGANYETHIRKELERLVPSSIGFLDAGANVGVHSFSAKSIKPDLPVVAVEMAKENIDLLARSIQLNKLDIILIPVAISAAPSIVARNQDATNPCCTSHGADPLHFPHWTPALPLDFYNLPPIDLIKMDIEGFEYTAWRGMSKLWAQRPRMIFELCMEVVDRSGITPLAQLQWLIDLGYRLTVLDFLPGMRRTCSSAQEVLDHIAATSKWIADILAEPV